MTAVPEAVIDSVRGTLTSVNDLGDDLNKFLSMAEPDVLAQLPPLQRARAFLALAKAASSLLTVRLRCNGIRPEDHAIKTEFERLSLYEDKLERFSDWNKAPLRPSTIINRQAAARVIGHSLPDLTQEQRQGMLEISKAEGRRGRHLENRRAHKKMKHQSSEKQSARIAAQEFLEKAARELLGSSDCGMKGPLRDEASDEEDDKPVN